MSTVPEDVFEDVLREVLRLHHANTLAVAVDIGRLLVERFYGGDLAAVRSRGEKDVTLKKLGERLTAEGTDLSATALWRHLSLYELDRRIPLAGRKLTPTHVRAVFRLAPEAQAPLLDEAEAEGWTTRELEAQVEARFPPPSKPGKPRASVPPAVKTLRALWRRASDERAMEGLDAIATLPLPTARRTLDQLGAVRSALDLLEAALKARVGSPSAPPEGGGGDDALDADLPDLDFDLGDLPELDFGFEMAGSPVRARKRGAALAPDGPSQAETRGARVRGRGARARRDPRPSTWTPHTRRDAAGGRTEGRRAAADGRLPRHQPGRGEAVGPTRPRVGWDGDHHRDAVALRPSPVGGGPDARDPLVVREGWGPRRDGSTLALGQRRGTCCHPRRFHTVWLALSPRCRSKLAGCTAHPGSGASVTTRPG